MALTTLGCKVNRADGLALLESIGGRARLVPFEEEADLYIVNSCTVTATADRQTRQLLYRARRRNPAALVVLTGCFARVSPEEAARIPGVDRVFALDQQAALVALVEGLALVALVEGLAPSNRPGTGAERAPADARARPYLKVQDGCDASCSYCIVPRARGRSRSTPVEEVLAALERLAGAGEVVLSGIHLGAYGRDLDPPSSLATLLERALRVGPRLRLSSVEPQEVDAALRALLVEDPALCPHLHLPIQSGDDEVLAAMNRPYRAAELRDLLEGLRRDRADLALGADLIAGFPGETEAQAAASLALVEGSAITHLHVFPFSPRPGTPAAERGDQIPRSVVRARATRLREAGRRKLLGFAAAQVGRVREVLIEGSQGELASGLTENYLRAEVRGEGLRIGARVMMQVEEVAGAVVRGRARSS